MQRISLVLQSQQSQFLVKSKIKNTVYNLKNAPLLSIFSVNGDNTEVLVKGTIPNSITAAQIEAAIDALTSGMESIFGAAPEITVT